MQHHPLNKFQDPLALIGRVLIALLFVPGGFNKLMGFAGTVGYIASKGLPMPSVAAAIAIIVEVGGSLALIAGFGTRWAALALAAFTFVASFFFHNYWGVPAEQAMVLEENVARLRSA